LAQKRLGQANEDIQRRLADLQRESNQTQNQMAGLQREGNLTQKQVADLQREGNDLQRATDALSKRQMELIDKLEHEPYFIAQWKKLEPRLSTLSERVKSWLDLANEAPDFNTRKAVPRLAEPLPLSKIDWTYSPSTHELLQQLEASLNALEPDFNEHFKLLLLADDDFWLSQHVTQLDASYEPSWGVFVDESSFNIYLNDMLHRLDFKMGASAATLRAHAPYQELKLQSNRRIANHIEVLAAQRRELQKTIEVFNAKFV
jgi:hypothetical protein